MHRMTPKLLVFGGLILSFVSILRIIDGGANAKISSTSTYFGRTVYNHTIKDELKPANATLIGKSKMSTIISGSYLTGMSSTQSMTITNDHIIIMQADVKGNNDSHMLVYEKAGRHNFLKDLTFKFGHANGITFDSKRNELLVVDEKKVHRVDASSFKYLGSKTVTNSDGSKEYTVTGIAYDSINDRYYMSSGKKIYTVTPGTFKLYNHMSSDHVQVNQDMGYYGGYIYRVVWAKDDAEKRGNFAANNNILLQFAADGSSFKAYYTSQPTCEMESIAFFAGKPFILYNACDGTKWTSKKFVVMAVEDMTTLKGVYHQYKMSYNANGGSWSGSAPSATNQYVGLTTTLTSVKPVRSGYDFLGWSKSNKATTASYVVGDKTVLKKYGEADGDLVLYAVWKAKPKATTTTQQNTGTQNTTKQNSATQNTTTTQTPTTIVSMNANGGQAKDDKETPVEPVVVTQHAEPIVAPTADDYERDGYVLDGWSTVENPTEDDVIYEPGEEINLPTTDNSSNVVLYAQWAVDETPDVAESSEKREEEKEELPKTGPVETAWLLLGLFAVATGGFLWLRSSAELYGISKKV